MNIEQIVKLMGLAPVVVAGIESIHGEADSATKQQLAQDSLLLATGVAQAVDPADAAVITPVAQGVSALIDSVVGIFNATGFFKHKPKPAPAPVHTIAPIGPVVATPDPQQAAPVSASASAAC